MTPALQVRGVTKAFAAPVLRGVDLRVAPGELVALLGPSGCGKTTLLRVVAGLERADTGTVEVAGHDVTAAPPEHRGVGLVPQEGALFPHLDVRANIGFGLDRRDRRRRGGRVDELLSLVGLEHLADRLPHQLSGGQQQRVALARALAPAPALVLLDEPFSALDADLRAAVREEVRRTLQAAGAAAVLVTHDQQEALSVADRVAVVRDGRVVQDASPWELYDRPADAAVASSVGDVVLLPHALVTADARVTTPLGTLDLVAPVTPGAATVVLRPEQLELVASGGVPATVLDRVFYGHDAMLRLRLGDGTQVQCRVLARRPGQPLPEDGAAVHVVVRGAASAFPA